MATFSPTVRTCVVSCIGTVLLLAAATISSQEVIDYNEYYQFDLSVGAEFRTLTPTKADIARDTSMTEFAAVARYPIPMLPYLQPFARIGLLSVGWLDPEELGAFDHRQLFLDVGAAYAYRFSKTFEAGASLSLGFGESIFNNLTDQPDESFRSDTLLASVGASLSLNPSYALSIDVKPALRFEHSLLRDAGERYWTTFDGFSFGLGFGVHYRFGEDPDAVQEIRSIDFGDIQLGTVYPAMQSWYVDNPIGSVTFTNIDRFPITNVEVSFFQEGFMDTPTVAGFVDELPAGETVTMDLTAAFNANVFKNLGVTPLSGKVIVTYLSRNKPATQDQSVNYELQDRTAITWDDDNKVGAFVTPQDSAAQNYASYVRRVGRPAVVAGFNADLQIAMQLYYALQEQGIIYQIDPNTPFTEMQENPVFVDSVSIARDTLERGTGDCDDLTVLFNTLMETVGMKTGFITTPGHIYSAFSTGLPADQYGLIHPDPDMTIDIDDELWIPVEITLVDSGDFLAAWRYGVEEYWAYEDRPDLRAFYKTAEAQGLYQSISLIQQDSALQYADGDAIVTDFRRGIDRIVAAIIDDYSRIAEDSGNKRDFNNLGIVAAQYTRYAAAERAFNTALSLDRNYMLPLINLGNVYFLQGQYQSALRNYHRAEEQLIARNREGSPAHQSLLLNIAKSYHALQNYDRAQEYYERLQAINPDMAARNTFLEDATGGRASRAQQGPGILFVSDEDEEE